MAITRFIALLAIALWLGSIFFFGAVLAPTVFHVLPTHTMAGNVVFPSLTRLHYIGLICGIIFILAALTDAALSHARVLSQIVLVVLMLALTVYAQFGIGRTMNRMRLAMGEIDTLPQSDPQRAHFNRLHVWSTRLEGTIFFLGLGVLLLRSRRLS